MPVSPIGVQSPTPLTLAPEGLKLASTPEGVEASTSSTDRADETTPAKSRSVARQDAIRLSKEVLADANESTAGPRTVSRALGVLTERYQAAEESSTTREQLASVGDRLIGLARDGKFLPADHADFATMAARTPTTTQPPTLPAPPPESRPTAAALLPAPTNEVAATGSTPQASKAATAQANGGSENSPARVALVSRSFTTPSGTGTNVPLVGRPFIGVSRKEGEGAQPSSWPGVSQKPYSEVYAGLTTGDLIFDAKQRLDAIKPQVVAGYSAGFIDENEVRSNVTVEIAKDLERGTNGDAPTSIQASYSRRSPDGTATRGNIQFDTNGRASGRLEQFEPVGGNGDLVRGRVTVTHSGVDGQAMNFSATLGLNPLPNAGNFTAPGTPVRPSLDVTVSSTAAPTSSQPWRVTKAVTVSGGVAGPGVVANAALSHISTGPNSQLRATGSLIVRLGANDIGSPPTTVTANGIDPVNMPTGGSPNEADGSNTTAYLRFAATLSDNGPLPKPGVAPGRDGITVGVVHTRNKGTLASVYAQGTYDTTQYANGASPTTRFSGDIGVHLRPIEGIPVMVGVNGNVGPQGPSVSVGGTIFLDKNTTVQAGGLLNLSNNEVSPYAQVRIR